MPADLQDHDEIEEALYLLCSRYVEMVSLHSLHSLQYDGESQLGSLMFLIAIVTAVIVTAMPCSFNPPIAVPASGNS